MTTAGRKLKGRAITVTCENCKQPFECSVSEPKRGKGRFCSRHCARSGSFSPRWGGGRSVDRDGRIRIQVLGRQIFEHIAVAERALGKPLPPKAVVHHVNRRVDDNRPSNLVICQDTKYHHLLHVRMRVRDAGGNPNTDRICAHCRTPMKKSAPAYCRPCGAARMREFRSQERANANC